MKRLWRYRYRDWTPAWYHYILPFFGMDENFRKTIVLHVPFFGFLVWAYADCTCEDCEAERAEGLWERFGDAVT